MFCSSISDASVQTDMEQVKEAILKDHTYSKASKAVPLPVLHVRSSPVINTVGDVSLMVRWGGEGVDFTEWEDSSRNNTEDNDIIFLLIKMNIIIVSC